MTEPKGGTISEDELEHHAEEACEIADKAMNITPRLRTWGFCAYSEVGTEGGRGFFLWFECRERMLDFVANHLTFWVGDPTNIDAVRVSSEVKGIVKEIENDGLTISEAIPRLNSALGDCSQIDWIGTFQDLVVGPGEFERGVRSWFREQQEGDASDGVITRKELKSFPEAIAEYGM